MTGNQANYALNASTTGGTTAFSYNTINQQNILKVNSLLPEYKVISVSVAQSTNDLSTSSSLNEPILNYIPTGTRSWH